MGNTLCPITKASKPLPKNPPRPDPTKLLPKPVIVPKDTIINPASEIKKPEEIKYIPNQDEQDVVFDGKNNKAFQFQNYKTFKKIKNIKKLFVFQKELGKGAFGEVYLATH
jgi:hypothetical protein